MDRIIKELLKIKFPTANTDDLLEIVNNTTNPKLATEIICGLYQEEVVNEEDRIERSKVLSFESYDKWLDQVKYSYQEEITKGAYFPVNIKQSDITLENFNELKDNSSTSETKYYNIKTGEYQKRTNTKSLSDWNSLEKEDKQKYALAK